MLNAADLYRALMVMRCDLDMINETLSVDGENLEKNELREQYADAQKTGLYVAKQADELLSNLKTVRTRFSGLEMLGMVQPVPAELLSEDIAKEG
jgi:hypothetical protein